jgi:transformation/transcription domain-associated protein
MDMIQIQPETQRIAFEEAKERGVTFVGVAPGTHNREMFAELIKAQVKVSR